MASSFTIWFKRQPGTRVDPSLELHVNLWIYDQKDNSIDFGLKISKPQAIQELYLYIPFIFEQDDLTNLTKEFADDKKTSELLFNDDVEFLGNANGLIRKTRIASKRLEYYLRDGIIETNLKGQELNSGRIIKYIFGPTLNSDDKYIRLRISNINNKGIIERYHKTHSFITGSYNIVTSLEINFHEFRKLPEDIYHEAQTDHIKMTLVNMFVMTDVHMEYIFSSIENVKSRILETEKWLSYNKKLEEAKNDRILAYQFKQKPSSKTAKVIFSNKMPSCETINVPITNYLEQFSIFAKFNDEGATKIHAIGTLFLVFFISLIASVIVQSCSTPNSSLSNNQKYPDKNEYEINVTKSQDVQSFNKEVDETNETNTTDETDETNTTDETDATNTTDETNATNETNTTNETNASIKVGATK